MRLAVLASLGETSTAFQRLAVAFGARAAAHAHRRVDKRVLTEGRAGMSGGQIQLDKRKLMVLLTCPEFVQITSVDSKIVLVNVENADVGEVCRKTLILSSQP